MKIMIQWRFANETYEQASRQFLETGAPDPAGVKTIGRWHAASTKYGFQVVEGDPADVAVLTAQWCGVADVKVTPVIDDSELKAALTKASG